MNLLISTDSNPYINLATEEYLLKNSSDDLLFIYINQPCVVVGKHQIALKEINSRYVFDNNILVARRLSGGGAVYHDGGNLNFSFIQSTNPNENISYKNITRPIFDYLLHSGIEISWSERNDMIAGGKKISGSAMHIFKNRLLAHGTLLIDCNLVNLSRSLNGNPGRYTDKSIASRRAKVMNLTEVNPALTIDSLLNSLVNFLKSLYGFSSLHPLSASSIQTISALAKNKYATDEWIYCYSPKYKYTSVLEINSSNVPFYLEVEKGIIASVSIESKVELKSDIILKLNDLVGLKHCFPIIHSFLGDENYLGYNQDIFDALF